MLKKQLVLPVILVLAVFSWSDIKLKVPLGDFDINNEGGVAVFTTKELGGEPGEPMLPVYKTTLLLPPNADLSSLSFKIEGLSEKKIDGEFDVLPTPPPTTIDGVVGWPDRSRIVDGRAVDVYLSNEIFPASSVKIIEKGCLGVFKIVTVEVSLVRYNPVEKTLLKLNGGELVASYSADQNYKPSSNSLIPSDHIKRLKKRAVNYGQFINDYLGDFRQSRADGLAIIITSSMKDKLDNFDLFVASKEAMGFKVYVETESEWGGGTGSSAASNIRKWLQDNYKSLGLSYVILVGNPSNTSGDVPMSWFTGYSPWSGHTDCPTDWHYAQLTGDYKSDYTCELHTGRFPVFAGDYTTVDKVMKKSVDYANASSESASWRFNALLGGPGYDASNTACKALNSAYHSWIEPNPQWEAFRCYSTKWGAAEEADVVGGLNTFADSWANGKFGVVDWGTHGAPDFAEDVMSSSKTTSIGNDYPAFVYCGSCSNADITSSTNLTYSIMKNCGIAAVGGTNYTMVSDDMVWCEYYIKYIVNDKLTFGETVTELLENHSNGWYNRGPYVIYGDPTLSPYTFQSKPFIAISNPSLNKKIEQNSTCTIEWSDNIDSKVKIELLDNGTVVKELSASTESDGSFDWEITTNDKSGDNYSIRITDLDSTDLVAESGKFSIVPEFIIADFPYTKDFDDLTPEGTVLNENWTQSEDDDIDWTVFSGPTPSKTGSEPDKTGPDADHTTGSNGNYLYVEASDPNNPDKSAVLVSPKFNIKNLMSPKLNFWVHMFSANKEMGSLTLSLVVDGVEKRAVQEISGDHGDEWFEVEQDLSDYKGERVIIKLTGTTGSSWCSDICIDDIVIDGMSSAKKEMTAVKMFSANVLNGNLIFTMPSGAEDKGVYLSIYSLNGKLVRSVILNGDKSGRHIVSLSGVEGRAISSGVYICKIKSDNFSKKFNFFLKK